MSLWGKILSAPSTSEAVERAVNAPIQLLSGTALPYTYDKLSRGAQRNLRAVRRALNVKVAGLSSSGWELWDEAWDESVEKGKDSERDSTVKAYAEEEKNVLNDDLQPDVRTERKEPTIIAPTRTASRVDGAPLSSKGTVQDGNRSSHTDQNVEPADMDHAKEPSPADVKHAEQLRQWALSSPHTEAPNELVEKICHSVHASALLNIASPGNERTDSLAAIINTFKGRAGSNFAALLVKQLVIPYTKDLTTPAPRDVMQAIVSFSEEHWRSVTYMYEYFAGLESPVNGAVAEVLARVSAVITAEGAAQSLQFFCSCPKWGEDGIRVVEALLAKCGDRPNVAGFLVQALDRNATFCEKSVRFGKLLFTTVKEVPEVTANHKEAMETICSRSKVFLGKRALALLKTKSSGS